MKKFRHGSLFSGIGGFDLAAEWMGWENVFHCEWNEFGQKVLNHYWPKAECFGDITKTDFTKFYGTIDIISGGFPCQPYSQAGKRLGKEDDRHLWPEMLRAIREIRPRYVVGENVPGLINWNGGLVFEEVQAEMEAEGYEVTPFILPACGVNAPHRRDRVWFIAHSINGGHQTGREKETEKNRIQGEIRQTMDTRKSDRTSLSSAFAHSNSRRIKGYTTNGGTGNKAGQRWQGTSKNGYFGNVGGWESFPAQPPICDGNDGISPKLDGITFSKWRNESIKAGGNAIVPQVVFKIFKAIQQYETRNRKEI